MYSLLGDCKNLLAPEGLEKGSGPLVPAARGAVVFPPPFVLCWEETLSVGLGWRPPAPLPPQDSVSPLELMSMGRCSAVGGHVARGSMPLSRPLRSRAAWSWGAPSAGRPGARCVTREGRP